MSDLFRKQILHARNKLADTSTSVNEAWLTNLIGASAAREVKADTERRVAAELSRKGIVVPLPPNLPQLFDLDLSDAAIAYWSLVKEAQKAEPELNWYKPVAILKRLTKIKLRLPKRIQFVAGHVVFTPKLNRRDSFVAGLHTIVETYERLPARDKARFTTDGGPEMGGLRFPRPVAFAQAEQAFAVHRTAAQTADAVRSEITKQSWLDALDRAAGQKASSYKIGGRLRVEKEPPNEQPK